jgi:predicted TIM-barrel fold metal-dependent hydrolase
MHTSERYTGPIFDADTHLYETEDAYSRYLPEKYRQDWSYQWKTGNDGEYALYVGKRKIEISAGYFSSDGKVPPPGKLHEWLRAMKAGNENVEMRVPMTPDMIHPEPRLKKMDEFGVDGCILYCGNMIATISYLDQLEPAKAIVRAYNEWMLDEWKFNYKDRIFSAPLLMLEDLDYAVAQAKWMVKNGTKLVLLPMGPINNRAPADPYFDPLWSVLNEASVNVVFHISEAIYMRSHMEIWGQKVQQSRLRQSAFVYMHGYSERPVVETLSSFVFWNFFERFPNIKLLSAENGAEWVPSMLVKMDKCRGMAKNGYWPCGQLKERPSKIFMRCIRVVAYPEDDLASIVAQTAGNADWLLMGSDYPHAEGVPTPGDFYSEACGGLTADQSQRIMHDNGVEFVGPR